MLRDVWSSVSELRRDRERAVLRSVGLGNDVRNVLADNAILRAELQAKRDELAELARSDELAIARRLAPLMRKPLARAGLHGVRALRGRASARLDR